jgi:steroid delta-isomerase-like uncharacterized protein
MRKIGQILKVLIPVIALGVLVVLMTGAATRLERNKAILMRALEAWNKGDMPAFDEVYASDVIRHDDTVPEGVLRGREALKQHVMNCRTAWPDFRVTLADGNMIFQGDKAAARWVISGTNTGVVEKWPAPTGKKMVWEVLEMYRFAGGKIVEDWAFNQDLVLFYQWGLKLVPAEQPGK